MERARHPIRLPASLSDGVVLLDEHRLEDAAADLAGEDDEIRRRFDGGRPANLAEAEDTIRRYQARRLAGWPEVTYALRLPDGPLIGGIEFRRPSAEAADVGYWLFPPFRGYGYARRALTLLCAAAERGIDGLAEIAAHVEPDNVASLRTAEAAGFRRAGEVTENGVRRLRLVRRR